MPNVTARRVLRVCAVALASAGLLLVIASTTVWSSNHRTSDYSAGTWSYIGHQDRYNVQWSCPDDYEKPAATHIWLPDNDTTKTKPLPTYTAQNIPSNEIPTCVRAPTLTVSNASAEEGGTLEFTVTLRHVSGEVKWGTLSDSSGANPACFTCSAPNKGSKRGQRRNPHLPGCRRRLPHGADTHHRRHPSRTKRNVPAAGYRTAGQRLAGGCRYRNDTQ